ncbi:MAG: hypothetical protein ACXVTC_26065, partial [Solirubrobacteraceae bacterium]
RTSREAPVRLGRPDASPAAAVLARAAGNRAVGGLIRSLQRQPIDYTKEQQDVENTKMTRFEVHDLAFGIRSGFQDRYGKSDDDVSDESNKTSESPNRMAVVVMPDKLDPDKPVQIILHFHGWGFRWNSSAHDPYAGYLVSRGRGGRPAAGTVRDVHQEHWEQQLSAFQGKGAQVMAILAQGIGKSQFGSFPTYEYVRDVLMKSGKSELVSLAGKANYSVVLSAHSGGGSRVAGTILAGNDEAETADRGALRPQTPDEAQKRVVNQLQPVELVVLYEAINGENDRNNVMDWVDRQLGRLGTALTKTPDKAKDALAATPVFRGYYGKRSGSSYTWPYEALACDIELSIQENIPAQFQDDARDHFRVIRVAGPKGEDVGHERVISGIDADPKTGSLADALSAQRDPKSDRSRAVGCGDLGPAGARRKKRNKK